MTTEFLHIELNLLVYIEVMLGYAAGLTRQLELMLIWILSIQQMG